MTPHLQEVEVPELKQWVPHGPLTDPLWQARDPAVLVHITAAVTINSEFAFYIPNCLRHHKKAVVSHPSAALKTGLKGEGKVVKLLNGKPGRCCPFRRLFPGLGSLMPVK